MTSAVSPLRADDGTLRLFRQSWVIDLLSSVLQFVVVYLVLQDVRKSGGLHDAQSISL